MAKEYNPHPDDLHVDKIEVKGITKPNYTKLYNQYDSMTPPMVRNAFYINTTPKTIKELFPYDLYLNYCSTTGFISADNISEADLIANGFAKINISDKEQQSSTGNIRYVEGNIKSEFLVKIASNGKYFNLYVPVVDPINNQ